jgi:hypothetical protein
VDLGKLYVDLALTNERDERVVHARASQVCNPFPVKADTRFFVEYCFESPRLAPGVYTLTVYAKSELGLEFWAEKIPCLTIKSESDFGQALTFDGLTAAVVPKFTIRVAECEGVASS